MTGEFIWSVDLGSEIYASVAVGDELVYIYGLDGVVHAIARPNGDIVWTARMGGPAYLSPVLVQDVVYAITENDGQMYAFDAINGERSWSYQTGSQGDWRSAAPVIADGVSYITSNTERLLALTGKIE
jgi:outer membrane protein assembly factor BamB